MTHRYTLDEEKVMRIFELAGSKIDFNKAKSFLTTYRNQLEDILDSAIKEEFEIFVKVNPKEDLEIQKSNLNPGETACWLHSPALLFKTFKEYEEHMIRSHGAIKIG